MATVYYCQWHEGSWLVQESGDAMNRIQIDISDSVAEHLEHEAETRGVSVAEYVRELLESQARGHDQWPNGFFERVAGSWKGADAILITHNTGEFSRVSNLRIEDWELED